MIDLRYEQDRKLIELHLEGKTVKELSKIFNVSCTTIRKKLKRNGVKLKLRAKPNVERDDKIKELHNEGLSSYEIGRQLDIHNGIICSTLKRLGLKSNGQIKYRKIGDRLVDRKDEIIKMYESGVGAWTIAKKLNADHNNITKLLRANNIKTGQWAGYKYNADHNFFEVIDTEEKAYILGILITDGAIVNNNFIIRMTDYDVVKKIHKAMKCTYPIHTILPKWAKMKLPQYSMSIYSKKIKEDLATKFEIRQNKTYTVKFPTEEMVPTKLISHFIRGVTDGDGSIYYNTRQDAWLVGYVGTTDLMRGISDICMRVLNNRINVINHGKACDERIRRINFGGSHQVKKWLDWMYNGATIYMDRKFQRYQEFLYWYDNKYPQDSIV